MVVQQLGDTEIEQLDRAIARDQNVRRFQVAMDDPLRMSVRDGREHVEEQAHSCMNAQRSRLALAIDLFPFDILEHQIRPAMQRAGVE